MICVPKGALLALLAAILHSTMTSPVWMPQFLSGGSGRNIRHLPCVSRRTGETGVCMFAFACMKANGTHLGTCIDRFYFGSCCRMQEENVSYIPNTEDNNVLPVVTTTESKYYLSTFQSIQDSDNKVEDDDQPTGKPIKPVTLPTKKPTVPEKRPTPSSTTTKLTTTDSTTTRKTTTFTSTTKEGSARPTVKPFATDIVTATQLSTTTGQSTITTTSQTTRKPVIKPNIPQETTTTLPVTQTMLLQATTREPVTHMKPTEDTTNKSTTQETSPSMLTTKKPTSSPETTTRKPVTHTSSFATTRKPVTEQTKPPTTATKKPSTHDTTTRLTPPETTTRKFVTLTQLPQSTTTTTKTETQASALVYTTRKPTIQTKPPSTTTRKPVIQTKPETTTRRPETTTRRPETTTRRPETTTRRPVTQTKVPETVTTKPAPQTKPDITTRRPTTQTKPDTTTTKPMIMIPISYPVTTTSTLPFTKPKPSAATTTKKPVFTTTRKPPTKKPTIKTTERPAETTTTTTPAPASLITWTMLQEPPRTEETATTMTTSDGWIQIPVTTHPPSLDSTSHPGTSTSRFPDTPPDITTTPKTTTTTTTTTTTIKTTSRPEVTSSTAAAPEVPSEEDTLDFDLNTTDFRQVCGRRLFPESRIVGGEKSSFGKWPWQISLRQWRTSTYLHKCGAALLNENWAITAAHCVENVPPSDLLLRLGEHDLSSEEEPYGYQERRVQIVASHPQFDPRTFEYDLALLRFYEPVTFQPNILPICVPHDDTNFVGHTAYVTGWGRLYEDGPLPSVLQEVSVPVINNTVCETMYRSAGYIEHIPEIFICAGWRKGGFDSCEGDSGGPMVIQRPDKRWLLAGVISWGIGCAEPNQPGVYTRISEFREWINQILQF